MNNTDEFFDTENEIENQTDEREGCVARMATGSESEFEESDSDDTAPF